MKRPSLLTRYVLQRRRVHSSWKTTLLVSVVGGGILLAGGLVSGGGVFAVVGLVSLIRPAMELYFSRQCVCPHCEADLFLEVCEIENAEGIESGLCCPTCRLDASEIDASNGQVIDIG